MHTDVKSYNDQNTLLLPSALYTVYLQCIPVSLSYKVVRLEERDRYRQLVAQFTNIETPDRTDRTGNRTVLDEPLYVETDFLTKTRSYTRYK